MLATLIKKRLSQRCFPTDFAKFSRKPFYRTSVIPYCYYIQQPSFVLLATLIFQKFLGNHIWRCASLKKTSRLYIIYLLSVYSLTDIFYKCYKIFRTAVFNPIQDGLFPGCSRMGCTYPKMMKLDKVIHYLKEDPKKHVNPKHSLCSADISIFEPEISNQHYTKKYGYSLHFDT